MKFDVFFKTATGHAGPFDYQRRVACGEQNGRTEADWLSQPDPDGCRSRLINIPTGLGKTADVVLVWLWNRLGRPSLNPQRSSSTGLAVWSIACQCGHFRKRQPHRI